MGVGREGVQSVKNKNVSFLSENTRHCCSPLVSIAGNPGGGGWLWGPAPWVHWYTGTGYNGFPFANLHLSLIRKVELKNTQNHNYSRRSNFNQHLLNPSLETVGWENPEMCLYVSKDRKGQDGDHAGESSRDVAPKPQNKRATTRKLMRLNATDAPFEISKNRPLALDPTRGTPGALEGVRPVRVGAALEEAERSADGVHRRLEDVHQHDGEEERHEDGLQQVADHPAARPGCGVGATGTGAP